MHIERGAITHQHATHSIKVAHTPFDILHLNSNSQVMHFSDMNLI